MAYFPLHQVRLPPRNVSRARMPGLLIFPCLAVFAVGLVFDQDGLAFAGFLGATLAAFTTFVLLVPVISLSVVFMLTPAASYILADFHDYPITERWWFWTLCFVCAVFAIVTLKIAGKLYPRRNEN